MHRSGGTGYIDDGRRRTIAHTTVNNQGHIDTEFPGHPRRRCDRWLPVPIGAGRGQGANPVAQPPGPGMGRTAEADGAAIATEDPVDIVTSRHHDRQGPGPEAADQAARHRRQAVGSGELFGPVDTRHQHREFQRRRTQLHLE